MRKIPVITAIALGLLATPSMAADLSMTPAYKAPFVAAPLYNWTGFYLGGNIGYGWGRVKPGTIDVYNNPAGPPTASIPGIDYNIDGIIGGVQAGYNWQFNNVVFGLEADFSGTGIDGSVTDPAPVNYTISSQIDWLATVRGRLGYTFGRIMPYVTGGLAVGHAKATLDDRYNNGALTITTKDDHTMAGWTIGGGVEMPVTPHWTLKAEYLYVDLGSQEFDFHEPNPPGWPLIAANPSITANIVRVGANYRF